MMLAARKFLRCLNIPLFAIVVLLLAVNGCSNGESADACAVLQKADVEKILSVSVHNTVVQAKNPMSISEGQVVETESGCIYILDAADGKPARVAVHVVWFKRMDMLGVHWDFSKFSNAEFAHAHPVSGLGEEAWQGQGLKLRKGHFEVEIEVDDLPPEPPPHSVNSTLPTRLYPELEVALAHIAAKRL
jgi:hypothetical protein